MLRRNRIIAFSATALLAIAAFMPVSTASNLDGKSTIGDGPRFQEVLQVVDDNPEPITIGGKTFTAKDGLKKYSTTVTLSPGANPTYDSEVAPTDWLPNHNQVFYRGSSYVKNRERGYLWYTGEVYAAANIHEGERVIMAQIVYSRNGEELGRASSHATYGWNSWNPGPVETVSVNDDLCLDCAKTSYHYNFYTVDPRAVG